MTETLSDPHVADAIMRLSIPWDIDRALTGREARSTAGTNFRQHLRTVGGEIEE